MQKARYAAAAATAAAGLAASVSGAHAAGFAIKEQSPTAQGAAFAGATAEAADVTYMFFNPAALSRQSGTQGATALSLVAPTSQPETARGETASGTPITGGDGGSDISDDALAPAFYGMTSVTQDVKLGVGINAPFGLETSYDDGWVGRYHALNSELATININPTVSYEPIDGVALGAGLQAQYITAELTNAVDFGSIGAAQGIPFATPTQNDGRAEVEGDDWGFGFTLGVLLEPREGTRVGVGYRSEVEHELTGDVDFSGGGQVRSALARNNAFADTGAEAEVTTPDILSVGAYQDLTEELAVMGEFQYTFWSDFDQLNVRFDNATPPSRTEEDWDNSWFAALGVKYDATENLALRTGVAYDESPIPDATRTPRIPGSDRTWLSFGADYSPYPWLGVKASYTYIFADSASLNLDATDPGNQSRGDLSADFDNHVNIATFSAVLRF